MGEEGWGISIKRIFCVFALNSALEKISNIYKKLEEYNEFFCTQWSDFIMIYSEASLCTIYTSNFSTPLDYFEEDS